MGRYGCSGAMAARGDTTRTSGRSLWRIPPRPCHLLCLYLRHPPRSAASCARPPVFTCAPSLCTADVFVCLAASRLAALVAEM